MIFDTAAIRERVVAAWTASPARFREDANAEDDLALGAYKDRLVVELAQNAADAAARAGVPGVLRLSVSAGVLEAANTGAPLDANGVQALATLRASAKRDGGTVGRFGVGFAAVLAVSDAPEVISRNGSVRFSRASTAALVREVPALAEELAARDGRAPALRLPWPAEGAPPDGFDTVVRLPLLPAALSVAERALDELDAELLLALPGLARIEVGGRVLERLPAPDGVVLRTDGVSRTWRVVSRSGVAAPSLMADRPVEERPQWTVTWALPVSSEGLPLEVGGRVLHAPTPSDEPVSLPVRLIATFPLDPARRHVAAGPLTDFLVGEAASLYAELVASLPASPAVLALVPRARLAAAALDAALAEALLGALRTTAWLPDAAAEPRVAPRDATALDAASPELVAALADAVHGLLPAPWTSRGNAAALELLGVRRLSTADAVDLLSGVEREPAWWGGLYAALEYADREQLAGLPVPLVDGRTVTGPRGLLLPVDGVPPAGLDVLGLRVVHPDAAHPLLERLGAVPAGPRAMLEDGRVRSAVESSLEADDPGPVADAVLGLVAAADLAPGELPWLAELALPTRDGDWAPAGELLLPTSPLVDVFADDAPFEVAAPSTFDASVLTAVGVLDSFAVLRAADVDAVDAEHDLDGEEDWYDTLADLVGGDAPPRLAELVAARDLELVADWPAALPLLLAVPELFEPVLAEAADGTRHEVPSYTRWWLSTHPVLGGRRPVDLRLPTALDLAGLYDVAPDGPAAEVGVLTGLDDVLADPDLAEDLLHRLGDPVLSADPLLLRTVYARLAVALDGYDVEPPARVRFDPLETVLAEEAVLLDRPYLLPLLADRRVVPAGGQQGPVADLLDVDFASEVVSGAVTSDPIRTVSWSSVPGAELAALRCGARALSGSVSWHDPLLVSGVEADWWPGSGDGPDHVSDEGGVDALGRALAWRLDRWDRRAAVVEALARPDAADLLTAEDASD